MTVTTNPAITGVQTLNNSPTIVAPNIVGTTTNDAAAAGSVGQLLQGTLVEPGAPVSLTTSTAADITSISLTPGDWEVTGVIGFNGSSTTTVEQLTGGISQTSATLPASYNSSARLSFNTGSQPFGAAAGDSTALALAPLRVSLASTTTLYLVAKANFAVASCAAFGRISARRMR